MNGEWCYFRSYLSKYACENIIKLAKEMPADKAVIGGFNNQLVVDEQFRRSNVRFVNRGNWKFQELYDTLWKTAIQANEDFFNFHITRLNYFQIAEYDSSYLGEYKLHQDTVWLNGDPHYHRKLSCIIQLSDPNDYEGGQFEISDALYPPSADELNQQGTIIFFPSFLRHRALPVTAGTRYSIAAWFEGPKWR
jgi:PKHD-type hydroxylase